MKKGSRSRRDQRGDEAGGRTVEGSLASCRKHDNARLSERAHVAVMCIMQMMYLPEQKRINQTV